MAAIQIYQYFLKLLMIVFPVGSGFSAGEGDGLIVPCGGTLMIT